MLRRKFTLEESLHLVIVATKVQETVDRELGDALLAIAGGDDSKFAAVHDRLNVLGRFDGADRIRKLIAPLFAYVGFRRDTGHIHAAKLYGHADNRGKVHALNGDGAPHSGKQYVALCGKGVTAEHDGESFNVLACANGWKVSCKQCAAIVRKETS